MKKLITLQGPTACGKTKLGVMLAHHYGGEIVSIDSMQIYKGLTIGTAAPTEEEMEGIPHHMVAIADVWESYSVARFVEEATAAIEDIFARGKLPILVGGTGLYLDAVLKGRSFAGGVSGGEVRRKLEEAVQKEGIEPLLMYLKEIDPDSYERLHPADTKRIIRAIEVFEETGKTITEHNRESRQVAMPYRPISLALAFSDREEMKTLINRRVDAMVEAGLLEEVRWLLSQNLPPTATALQAIGYKEFAGYLRGDMTLPEAVEEVKLRSRQYAKRQLTWLRRQEHLHFIWWEGERNFDKALQEATSFVNAHGV